MFQVSLLPSSGEQTACPRLWCSVLDVVVVVPESHVVRCVHCEEAVAGLLPVQQQPLHSAHLSLPDSPEPQQLHPGQNTIDGDTQSALLMMGIKTPKTC
jgi:hypothetical protein